MTRKVTQIQVVQLNPSAWLVSEDGEWLPGIYADADAALTASTLGPELLDHLWDYHRPCPMTQAMLTVGQC
jgi:hypothetical protein